MVLCGKLLEVCLDLFIVDLFNIDKSAHEKDCENRQRSAIVE